jgi:3-hydroxymyristoyl/3-hydroxydecanoyl-(acyl carrier protein) dehydratase
MRFVFIDRIERIEKNKFARGIKTISFEEGFLKSPYSEDGYIPQLLLLESSAQLASWLIMYSSDFTKIPMLARIEKVSLFENVQCGTRLSIEIKILSSNNEGALINAKVFAGDKLIARGENCMCVFANLEEFAQKSEMKARFLDLSSNAQFK